MKFANSVKVLFGLLVLNAIFYNIEAGHRSKRNPFYQYLAARLSNIISPMAPVFGSVTVGEIAAASSSSAVLSKSSISAMDKINFVLDSFDEMTGKTTTTTRQPGINPSRKMPTFRRATYSELEKSKQHKNSSTQAEHNTKANSTLAKIQNSTEINNYFNARGNRSRRFAISAFIKPASQLAGLAGTIIAAGAVTSTIDSEIRKKYDLEAEERLVRKTYDCAQNNYGCFDRLCWANCGPRLNAPDWCITTNGTFFENGTAIQAPCDSHRDCDSCWPCATHCKLEGLPLIYPRAPATTKAP